MRTTWWLGLFASLSAGCTAWLDPGVQHLGVEGPGPEVCADLGGAPEACSAEVVVHDAFVTGPRKLEGAELAEVRRTASLVLAGLDDCSAVPGYYALLTFFPGAEGLPSDVTVSDVDASGGGAAAVNPCLTAAVTGVRWPQGAGALTIIAVRKGTGADDKVRFGCGG